MSGCKCNEIRLCSADINKLNNGRTQFQRVQNIMNNLTTTLQEINIDLNDTLFTSSMEELSLALDFYSKRLDKNYNEGISSIDSALVTVYAQQSSFQLEDRAYHERERRRRSRR